MAIFRDINNLPSFRNPVLTIGTFDGVHKGHRAILSEVVWHAGNVGGESILLTFEPHPRKLLFPDQPLGIITPLADKLGLVSDTGIQHIIVAPFTREFASFSANDYIRDFLVGKFHPHTLIIGYDHRFGHDRKGDIRLLEQYSPELCYELVEIPAQLIDEATVSSTKIRHAITGGRMEDAMHMLGRPYALKGTVVHGNKLGRTIGYPTLNIQPLDADQIIPGLGIYVIRTSHNGHNYNGMMSIGYNPTVTDARVLKIEAHLFDFDQEIYGEEVELLFLKKLREEEKFESLAALREQLGRDKEDALKVLNS